MKAKKSNSNSAPRYATLAEMLQDKATRTPRPDAPAYLFLEDGDNAESRLEYRDLDRKARSLAIRIRENHKPGEHVVLLCPPGLDTLIGFFACIYAGVTAVPAYPPRQSRLRNQNLIRLRAIMKQSKPRLALTVSTVYRRLEGLLSELEDFKGLQWINIDDFKGEDPGSWIASDITPESLALIQYTSGSTSAPKGVMLSHDNIMHNLLAIYEQVRPEEDWKTCMWLPIFHDLGLVGGILESTYGELPLVFMPPAAFLQRPLRWIRAISKYRATFTGGPNFSVELCARAAQNENLDDIDLSCLKQIVVGAEPNRHETMRHFHEVFKSRGFEFSSFTPMYGLAEAVVFVSGAPRDDEHAAVDFSGDSLEKHKIKLASSGEASARKLVGHGKAAFNEEIVIVDPEKRTPVDQDGIGEIWVHGPNVAEGYWGAPELSREVFHAELQGRDDGKRYLRTGDLGFVHEDQLYVTGRIKDLIIINGQNYYPQDIELTIQKSHESLRPDTGAAFSLEMEDGEHLVMVQELDRTTLRNFNADEMAATAQRAVGSEFDLRLHAIVFIKPGSLPRTSSGKIQRHACLHKFQGDDFGETEVDRRYFDARFGETVAANVSLSPDSESDSRGTSRLSAGPAAHRELSPESRRILNWLNDQVVERLHLESASFDPDKPFFEYGLTSAEAINMTGELEKFLERDLSPGLIYDYPTATRLARHLAGEEDLEDDSSSSRIGSHEPIAIIGLHCRFPGAPNPQAFWKLLREGVDAVTETPEERFSLERYYSDKPQLPGRMYTRFGAFLEDVDRFDADFFALSPREAKRMDPQQRILLEETHLALEAAGLPPDQLAGTKTGVFVGISSSDYSQFLGADTREIDAYTGTGGAFSISANRISYLLDLRGPSLAVDTACSSSLVAVHLACRSLREGESNLCIAAGVNLILTPHLTIAFSQARMMAADGRCKTFDESADGYVRGEGCGVVVLKRLSDALKDGDNILSVIRGSAVNQDGRSNGLTAPNGPSQQAVLRAAHRDAGVSAQDIEYVECHGTGTPLGDPIEIDSLKKVLLPNREDDHKCALGSVKTNIGHLEAAAGIAGLIKTTLSLQNEIIPPHLHLKKFNPHINLENTPLYVPGEAHPWKKNQDKKRLAGISSFGFGGANSHVILEEPPEMPAPAESSEADENQSSREGREILILSAHDDDALEKTAKNHAKFLETSDASLTDICRSAALGRTHYPRRLAVIASSREEMKKALGLYTQGESGPYKYGMIPASGRPRVAFLFTGQGSQYADMGKSLYEEEPVFKEALDFCAQTLEGILDRPLLDVIFSPSDPELINQTQYTQPAIFALEYALARLWMSWGVQPDMVLGHSVGEYVAAWAAGVIKAEDGLKLIAKRAALMQALPPGGVMAALPVSEEEAREALQGLEGRLTLAAVNGTESVVISGEKKAAEEVVAKFAAREIEARYLSVSHAFHSPLMDPMLDEFEKFAGEIEFSEPRIALVSNLTGDLLQKMDASYLRRHIREPVLYARGLETLEREGASLALEVGPAPVLSGMARSLGLKNLAAFYPSLRKGKDCRETILESLADLFVAGVAPDWNGVYASRKGRRVILPSYPFTRDRYWFQPNAEGQGEAGTDSGPGHPLLGHRLRERAEENSTFYWENLFNEDRLPFLRGHRVQGSIVVPGTAYTEMALAAVREAVGPGNHALKDMEFYKALIMPDESSLRVQAALFRNNGDTVFKVFSRAPGEETNSSWTLHAVCKIELDSPSV